jgi:hypothetical protein
LKKRAERRGIEDAEKKKKRARNIAVTDSASREKVGLGGVAGGVIVNEGLKRSPHSAARYWVSLDF